jgi:RNA polymerase sigma factor (sigma-70 family)
LTKPVGPPSNLVAFPKSQSQILREKRILTYLPLVEVIAKRLAKNLPPSFELDDIRGPGFVGLVEAIDSFRPKRGCALKVHVATCIDRAIKDSYRRRNWKEATHAEIGEAGHLAAPPVEFDRAIDQAKDAEQLAGAVKNLDTRERQVLHLIYVREQTVREAGEHLGLHNSNVTRIHRRAVGQLRQHYRLRGVTAA